MTNLETAKHYRVQLHIADEYNAIVPDSIIKDIHKKFTNAFSGLINDLINAENLTASDALKKAEFLLQNKVA